MNVGKFLADATQELAAAGVQTARLDCLILLEDILNQDRANLLAHPELPIDEPALSILNKYIAQREKHVPLAYIRGKAYFFGREFVVTNAVLVPRPETETMIELLLRTDFATPPRIADIGTGSGCLAITAGLEIPGARVYAYDIDDNALAIARRNAATYHVTMHARQSDLLASCHIQPDVILANLPYVPIDYPINTAANFEPAGALFSGDDGLEHYRTFWQQLAAWANKPSHVFTEALPEQHSVLQQLAQKASYVEQESEGYIQHFTVLPE